MFFSELSILLIKKTDKYKISKADTDNGSPKFPLINIFFDNNKWYLNDITTLLIQIQGNYIKFYCHYSKNNYEEAKVYAKNIIEKIKKSLEFDHLNCKIFINKKEKSFYLYKEKIIKDFKNIDIITLQNLEEIFYSFYRKIEAVI